MNTNPSPTPSMNPDIPSMDPNSNATSNENTNSDPGQTSNANTQGMNQNMSDGPAPQGQGTQAGQMNQGQQQSQFQQGQANQPAPEFQQPQSPPQQNQYANTAQGQNMDPNNPYAYQGDPNQVPQKEYGAVNNIVTILLLLFFWPAGLILMWVWTGWKTWVKIVITILAILMVPVIIFLIAVMSAINPVEQMDKASDAGYRSDAAELLNATERYYTSFRIYPWEEDPSFTQPPSPGVKGSLAADVANSQDWIGELIVTDELREEFADRPGLDYLYVWHDENTNLVTICFEPTSDGYQDMANYNMYAEATPGIGTYVCVPDETNPY